MTIEREKSYEEWTQIFENLNDDQFKIASYAADVIKDVRKREKNTRLMKEHNQTLVGKTYRRVYTSPLFDEDVVEYYKIISGYASDSAYITCLSFNEIPKIYSFYNNYYGGKEIKIKGLFKVADYLLKDFSFSRCGFEEISNEEWEAAFDKFCKQLKELKWEKK